MFTLCGNDFEHDFLYLLVVASGTRRDIGKRCRVDVEGLYVDEDFVVVNLIHVVVDFVCRLRQHAFRLNDAVCAVLVSFFHVVIFVFRFGPGSNPVDSIRGNLFLFTHNGFNPRIARASAGVAISRFRSFAI
ncbi:hypothetical protein SDC9_79143 [bioreactor metagenome]|uniref:Uncharacterized protein n=1 Tax=bioreactor metagenome TaxID=1076179 RepID=A0A644YW78_9ZZZZ